MNFLLTAGQVEAVQTRKNNSDYKLILTIDKSNIDPDKVATLMSYGMNQEFIWMAFKKEPFAIEEEDLLENLKTDLNMKYKTPSQRLRGTLYRLWTLESGGYEVFEDFYRARMEKIITHFQDQANKLSF